MAAPLLVALSGINGNGSCAASNEATVPVAGVTGEKTLLPTSSPLAGPSSPLGPDTIVLINGSFRSCACF